MTDPPVPAFLLDWARLAGPAKVLAEVRNRLERGRLGIHARVAVGLSPAERRQVGQLLDASWGPSAAPVSIRALRRGLTTHGSSLEGLLIALGGPLRNLTAEREESVRLATESRSVALAQLRALLQIDVAGERTVELDAALQKWVLRQAQPLDRVAAVSTVVSALPAPDQGVLLPVLAVTALGDAHGLDRNRRLGRAVARFLAVRAAFTRAASADDPMIAWLDPNESAEAWRAAWAVGGVACDTVSSQVLTLNLPLTGDAAAVRLCRAAASEPVWLTLRSLTGQLSLARAGEVFVCENPSILESAADRLGERSAPLICTFGRPSLSAIRLLRAIAGTATLRIRADGDSAGWGIMDTLRAAVPSAMPWRMPENTTAYEEELLELLLADLSAPQNQGRPEAVALSQH